MIDNTQFLHGSFDDARRFVEWYRENEPEGHVTAWDTRRYENAMLMLKIEHENERTT